MTQLALLGRLVPVTVDPAVQPNDATHALAVLIAATTFLQTHSKTLTPGTIAYIGSLAGLGIAPKRSFTPCAGTADQQDGDYVFYIGVEDLAINSDPLWWAGCIIHDGGHAWLSRQGQVSTGIAVEQMLTQDQIFWMTQLGNCQPYVDDLTAYLNDPAAIQARIDQAV
jgi:hypothetical protein